MLYLKAASTSVVRAGRRRHTRRVPDQAVRCQPAPHAGRGRPISILKAPGRRRLRLVRPSTPRCRRLSGSLAGELTQPRSRYAGPASGSRARSAPGHGASYQPACAERASGFEAIKVWTRGEAEAAGRRFEGGKTRNIMERKTGRAVRLRDDAAGKQYRFTHTDKSVGGKPHTNLENARGGNTHVTVERWWKLW